MTPEKQVSPVIRLSQGERDASARATHLEAATRKFLVTTNERKQMSTKTNFKRIALVAVASVGLSLLSSVPAAKAAVSSLTITATSGTAGLQNVRTDSSNAAVIRVSGLMSEDADSATITITQKSVTSGITPLIGIRLKDTNTGTTANSTVIDSVAAITSAGSAAAAATGFVYGALNSQSITDSTSVNSISGSNNAAGGGGYFRIGAGAANQFVDASFFVQMDSVNSTRVAGTFTGIASVTYWTGLGGATPIAVVQSAEFTITIAAAASDSKVASAATSTAVMSQGTADAGSTVDSSVSVAATTSTTANAVILVTLKNVSGGTAARESVTATTTLGQIGDGTTMGRSVTLAYTGALTLQLRADGSAGTATINISTPNVTFAAKTAVFYATTATTGVATKRVNTLSTGSNAGAITAVFKDANGNVIGGNTSVYAFSDALTVVSETASACTYDGANSRHTCSLTGVTAGTANITIGNAGKSVVSAAIPVTVSTAAPATLKMAWNKATYAPGEKAYLSVWAVDSTGKPVGSRTIPSLLAGGISTTAGFSGTGSPSIPNSTTSFALAPKLADTDGLDSLEPVYLYTVYMPSAGGAVTVSATGGGSLPAAGQVEVKATATVTDSGAAALAAVNALATTVASLKTLITTLTNLVLKIQKKVKA